MLPADGVVHVIPSLLGNRVLRLRIISAASLLDTWKQRFRGFFDPGWVRDRSRSAPKPCPNRVPTGRSPSLEPTKSSSASAAPARSVPGAVRSLDEVVSVLIGRATRSRIDRTPRRGSRVPMYQLYEGPTGIRILPVDVLPALLRSRTSTSVGNDRGRSTRLRARRPATTLDLGPEE